MSGLQFWRNLTSDGDNVSAAGLEAQISEPSSPPPFRNPVRLSSTLTVQNVIRRCKTVNFHNITHLNLSSEEIEGIGVDLGTLLPKLCYLNISDNKLTSLEGLANAKQLKVLSAEVDL